MTDQLVCAKLRWKSAAESPTMERCHSTVCILGGGAAALLSHVFYRRMGICASVVTGSMLGNLAPLYIDGVRLCPLPIFISEGSGLFARMDWQELIAENDYVTTTFSPMSSSNVEDQICPGSYAEFLVDRYSDAAQRLILAKKHIGAVAFQRKLPELCRKVAVHYPAGQRSTRRVGFRNGISFYLHYLEQLRLPQVVMGTICRIDLANRCVVTDSHCISYDRLVSTIPLAVFLHLARVPTALTTFGGSALVVVARAATALRPNKLIYDCDAASPIYRVFVPIEGFIVAQVAPPHWNSSDAMIAARMQELCELSDHPVVLERRMIRNCYPLSVSDEAERNSIIASMECSGVVLFGRLAQWEYRDIEELDWERIA